MTLWLILGALFAAVSVALGAYASHGLEQAATEESRAWLETAVRYAMWHSLALLAVAWLATRFPWSWLVRLAGFGFTLGILLFSGGLCVMALTDYQPVGPIIPLGGLAFVVSWVVLVLLGIRVSFETRR